MIQKLLTHRAALVWIAPAIALMLLFVTDADHGGQTRDMLINLLSITIGIGFLHWIRKTWFPYIDLEQFVVKAKEHPIGAGLVALGLFFFLGVMMLVTAGRAHAAAATDFELQQARRYLPVLAHELDARWTDIPMREYAAALAAHESGCPGLRRMCWNPGAQLKSSREEGAGLAQITRAYRADGSVRFDALEQLRAVHGDDLADLTWSTVYLRPDLQLRALVLMSRDNYRQIHRLVADPLSALEFADAAYNGGAGGVSQERRACAVAAGCDPQKWFGNVELHCRKSRAPLYGGRSACDINRHHVRDVVIDRAKKYRGLL